MKFVNLTPHDVTLFADPNNPPIATIPRSGEVARVTEETKEWGIITVNDSKVPVVRKTYTDVEGLPIKPQENTLFIVSIVVKNALPDRHDLITPDTGPDSVVRYEDGRIRGVRRFQV